MVEVLIYTATVCPQHRYVLAVQVTAAALVTGLSVTGGDGRPANRTGVGGGGRFMLGPGANLASLTLLTFNCAICDDSSRLDWDDCD